MKFQAAIGDKIQEVEIDRTDDGVRASIDGEPFDAEISQPEPNVFLFKQHGRIIEAFVDPTGSSDGAKNIWINGREHSVRLIDPKRLRGSRSSADDDHGRAEIRAAMPGKVVRVLTEEGANVEKGGGVLVVEAMKMQNELKSPKSGTVKSIKVSAGDTVSAGDVLAIVE
jgi:acetyl/propionyl-CoA carboxylase alpha subunit